MKTKKILKDLVKFNTIQDNQNKDIIDYIEKYLLQFGFKTEYKSKCLVMSNKEECRFGFLGHTDTVSYSSDWTFDPFILNEVDNKLYGLGTCDMKAGIAVILSIISKIDFKKFKYGVKLFFTYDEEIGFSGINELLNRKISFPDYMLIGEPTNNEIINSSKGLLEIKISFFGVSSHSSSPSEGVNAIENTIQFLNKLENYYEKIKREIIDSKYTTMNIGLINGGRSINIVPDYCEVFIDFRTIIKSHNEKIIKYIEKVISKYDARVEIINNIYPFLNDGEIVNMSDFISEASFIDSKEKIILGAGPKNAHKKDEFVSLESLEKLEKQYTDIIIERCKE